jgi:hypothetical protein
VAPEGAEADDQLSVWIQRVVKIVGKLPAEEPQDADLISEDFLRLFGRKSVPDPDPKKYPGQAEIRAVFDRVHEQAFRELRGLDVSELDQPVLKPHPWSRQSCGR